MGWGGHVSGSNWLSKVNMLLTKVDLVFVLLFIFVKKQIMCFSTKSWRRPHVPVRHVPPKTWKRRLTLDYLGFGRSSVNPSSSWRMMQDCYTWKPKGNQSKPTCTGWNLWMPSMPGSISRWRLASPFLNEQEFLLLPARTLTHQYPLQGSEQGPDRHPDGLLPMGNRSVDRVPVLSRGTDWAGHSDQSTRWKASATEPVSSQRPNPVSWSLPNHHQVTSVPFSQKNKPAKLCLAEATAS